MLVILPLEFSGGEFHLLHSGNIQTIDGSKTSLTNITILCWYPNVECRMDLVTKGCQLVLSYNLIYISSIKSPTALICHPANQNLGEALLFWRQDVKFKPLKLIYLLESQYPETGLSLNMLTGVDFQKVTVLRDLGKQLGFDLALAKLEYTCIVHKIQSKEGQESLKIKGHKIRVLNTKELEGHESTYYRGLFYGGEQDMFLFSLEESIPLEEYQDEGRAKGKWQAKVSNMLNFGFCYNSHSFLSSRGHLHVVSIEGCVL
jgi:hypothetical protein